MKKIISIFLLSIIFFPNLIIADIIIIRTRIGGDGSGGWDKVTSDTETTTTGNTVTLISCSNPGKETCPKSAPITKPNVDTQENTEVPYGLLNTLDEIYNSIDNSIGNNLVSGQSHVNVIINQPNGTQKRYLISYSWNVTNEGNQSEIKISEITL